MNLYIPYLVFIITFMICLAVIGNNSFFYDAHVNRQKAVVTMALIISGIVFIMLGSVYFCERQNDIQREINNNEKNINSSDITESGSFS